MNFEAYRLSTFDDRSITVRRLASSGFFYRGDDRIECAFCKMIVVYDWKEHPLMVHLKFNPTCPFIICLEHYEENITCSNTLKKMMIEDSHSENH